jgi:hypothetical protein
MKAPRTTMDLTLLQPVQQLFLLWKTIQQTGTLTITCDRITWTHNTTITDLTPVLTNSTPLTKKRKRETLSDYYRIGRALIETNGDRKSLTLSSSKAKTARRAYELVELIGEDKISNLLHIRPSTLARLSNSKFEELKIEAFLSVFGGPQTGEGDNLSPVSPNLPI